MVLPVGEQRHIIRMRFAIITGDVRKHGTTPGCGKCEHGSGDHSIECRRRFEELLKEEGDMIITRMYEREVEEALERLEEQDRQHEMRTDVAPADDEGMDLEQYPVNEDQHIDDTSDDDEMIYAVMGNEQTYRVSGTRSEIMARRRDTDG